MMDAKSKANFHRRWAQTLRSLALELGVFGSCDIRSNKGGPAVLGEVVLHAENFYLQVGGSLCEAREPTVMYRSCQGRKDYTGGPNHYMRPQDVTSEAGRDMLLRVAAEGQRATSRDNLARASVVIYL